jgi:hypothetical protein
MATLDSAAPTWFGVAALLVGLGALVRYRQWTFLIAGYDDTSPVPEEVAANVVGNLLLRVGLASAAVGAVAATVGASTLLVTVYTVAVLFAVARVVYRLNTYTPDDGGEAAG